MLNAYINADIKADMNQCTHYSLHTYNIEFLFLGASNVLRNIFLILFLKAMNFFACCEISGRFLISHNRFGNDDFFLLVCIFFGLSAAEYPQGTFGIENPLKT